MWSPGWRSRWPERRSAGCSGSAGTRSDGSLSRAVEECRLVAIEIVGRLDALAAGSESIWALGRVAGGTDRASRGPVGPISWRSGSKWGVLRRSEGLGAGRAGDRTPHSAAFASGAVGWRRAVESALEAEARAVDGEHFGVVQEAVEERGGQGFVAEGVGPFADGLVAGDDCRAARVAAVDDLKDAVGVGAVERQVAGFVEEQQVWALQLREFAGELAEGVGVAQAADEIVEGAVADEVAAGEGLHGQTDRDVCLAGAGRAQDETADAAFDEAQ